MNERAKRDSVEPAPGALDIATDWLLVTAGLDASRESLVASRILAHAWEGLRQYLAIRVGAEAVGGIMDALLEADLELENERRPKAELYRRARSALGEEPRPVLEPDDALYWRSGQDATYDASLTSLRRTLDADSWEALELRYARGLSLKEAATVVGWSEDRFSLVLGQGRELASRVLGPGPASRAGTLEGSLLEAFALRLPGASRRAHRAPVAPLGTTIGARYRTAALLGSGAFADVYEAQDLEVPGHRVALKVFRTPLSPGREDAAKRELQLLASVFHPSVVQFKDFGYEGRRFWFVMPLYEGETLDERLRRGPLSRAEARAILVPLASALTAMHRVGVRHQDIKPGNIFLARIDGQRGGSDVLPILLDLGVAARDAEVVVAGSPGYFAPEVAARFVDTPDPPPVSGKSDVFSLALSLRNALEPETREGVIGGDVDAFIALRATQAPQPPQGSQHRFLQSRFRRWLALSPDERPDAEELAREFLALTAPEEREERRRKVLRWLVPLLVVLGAIFGVVVTMVSRDAEVQRAEAMRARAVAELERQQARAARERVELIEENLSQEEALRRRLEEDIESLQARYETSQMTREELAETLAHIESELALLEEQRNEDHARFRANALTLEGERDALVEERDTLSGERDALLGALDTTRGEVESLEADTSQLRATRDSLNEELQTVRQSLESADSRIGQLEENLDRLRRVTDGARTATQRRPPDG